MQVTRIDHVAIAVNDLEEAEKNFCGRLGAKKILQKTRDDMGYVVAYLEWGASVITLVQPTTPKGFIRKHIDKFGEGLHHMGIEVEDLTEAERELIGAGGEIGFTEEIPGVRKEFVVPPRGNNGVLVQVIEYAAKYKGTAPDRYKKLADDGCL